MSSIHGFPIILMFPRRRKAGSGRIEQFSLLAAARPLEGGRAATATTSAGLCSCAAMSKLALALCFLTLLWIAGCGPPSETIDTRKYPWSYVHNRAELEQFLREYPEYAPEDAPLRP
jgi:hypothetical protein